MPRNLNAASLSPVHSGCRLYSPGVVCPLGDDLDDIARRLFAGQPGLRRSEHWRPGQSLTLGIVDTPLPDDSDWPVRHRSRNNRLLAAALQRIEPTLKRWRDANPEARIGVVMGTSTSGIGETEISLQQRISSGDWPPDFDYYRHEIGATADFVAYWCGVNGPVYTLSTACTSSARALSSASRLIHAGICDAVIAGGSDSLCRLTVNGFSSLEAISPEPCRPFSAQRNGINLGEGAAVFLVTGESGGIQLKGYGETSDAHHISAPRADGSGARDAMAAALQMAGITPSEVDYLNLHGTATRQNDSMEARAVAELFADGVTCGSTKSLTGHSLGTCGALEAAFCWLALTHDRLPPHLDPPDPELPSLRYSRGERRRIRRALSNAFAFGGNNIALLLERAE